MIKKEFLNWKNLIVLMSSLTLLLTSCPASAQAQADTRNSAQAPGLVDPDELEAFVDKYVRENMGAAHVPGLVVVVVEDGEVLLSKGYGYADLENQILMTPQTAVRAGSVSKPVVATAVIQLVERGLIDLNAPVSEYITDLDLEDEYGQASTAAQLLTHMGGYDDTVFLSHAPTIEEWQPLGEVLASDLPPRAITPGKVMAYSSWDYALLGYLIERVTGMPYEEAIAESLFTPLGMQDSTYVQPLPSGIADALAVGYSYVGGEHQIIPHDFVRASPGVALVTTGEDMGKYMLAILSGGMNILEGETVDLILQRQAAAHPYSRGRSYAFNETRLGGRNALYHDGNGIGFFSRMILVPEHKLGIFMTINHRNLGHTPGTATPATWMVRDLGTAILEAFVPESEVEIPDVQPLPDAAERAGRYVGHYHRAETPRNDFFKVGFLMDNVNVEDNGDGSIRIGSNTYVEVEPLLFQSIDTPSFFAVFVENDRGEVEFLAFGGTSTYQKADWYETMSFQLFLAGLSLLTFLSMAIVWPFKRQGHWMAWAVSLVNLAFIVGFGLLFMKTDYLIWFKTLPLSTRAVLSIPWVSGALSLSLPLFLAKAWRDQATSWWGRVHYSLVTLASFAFLWFVNYWNLILK